MSTQDHTRYRLRVSAGPGMDPKDLKVINVNDDSHPFYINSPEFVGQIVVRVKGLPETFGYLQAQAEDKLEPLPDSPWFQKPGADSNLSSVQISGRFKREWSCDQVVFGNAFEQPLRLPPFSSVALRFVQFIDPGLKADIYSDKPWAFSPLMATMNTVNVSGWHLDQTAQKKAETKEHGKEILESELPPWPSPEGEHIIEDTRLMFQDHHAEATPAKDGNTGDHEGGDSKETPKNAPLTAAARRSYFASERNLAKHTLRPDQVYGFDFFNPYLNFADFTLKIPGFSVDITRYWDGQPLKYVIKTTDSSVVFMAFQFELVPVTDIEID